MRKSRQEAAKTRERIIASAAAEFREHGITATGLADIRAELRLIRTEMQGLRNDIQQQGKELRGDFRWLLRFTIGGFVGMFALLARGLHWF